MNEQESAVNGQTEQRYRIAWRSPWTGATGHGGAVSRYVAELWFNDLRAQRNRDIEYWIEEAPNE